VHPEAVEGLSEQRVLAEGGLPTEAFTPVGTSEEAHRSEAGHRVADGEGGLVRSERKETLPEVLLYLPEVGRLPREGGPVYLAEGRKPFAVVTAEIAVDSFVGFDAQELAYDLYGLYGEDLGVGECRLGTALPETLTIEVIVHQAEDGYDEGAKIHKKKTSATLFGAIGSTPSVGRSPLWLKSSKKPAHGVS
jgi:hypothetical protein